MEKEPIRIGVLVCHLSSHYAQQLCCGIQQAAEQAGASVFFFPGSTSDDAEFAGAASADVSDTAIYQYAAHCCPDVLILSLGSISGAFDTLDLDSFLAQFAGIPTIILEGEVAGYRCISTHNSSGFTALLRHLVCDHHFTRIGYVDGRAKNTDAAERRQIFLSVMEQYGVSVSKKSMVRGDFMQSCEPAVARLLDDNPGLQAIVCANDDMALGAYREITRRGLRVGKDIALTGFDDSGVAAYIHPALTTVHSNTFSLGVAAVEEALRLLQGQPQKTAIIENTFVQRASCGCSASESAFLRKEPIRCEASFYKAMGCEFARQATLYSLAPALRTQLEQLMSRFVAALCEYVQAATDARADDALMDTLSTLFLPKYVQHLSLDRFQALFNILTEQLMETMPTPADRLALMQLVSRINRSISGYKCGQLTAANNRLRRSEWISSHIVSSALHLQDRTEVYREICAKVHELGARSCFLYLFDHPVETAESAAHQAARLCAWWDENGCHTPENAAAPLRPDEMIRNEALPQSRPSTMTAFSLFTGTEHLGLLLCECGLEVYQSLYLASLQAGAALKYVRLLEQQQEMLYTISSKNEMLKLLSTQDELTHILNRRGFLERMQQILRECSGRDAVLLYLDLDRLKTINDKFGHSAGDYALRALVQTILPTLSGEDIFARMGGDEFVALRLISPDQMTPYIASLRTAFDALNRIQPQPFLINASIGARAFVCSANLNLEDLLHDADERLYEDKQRRERNVLRQPEA